VKISNKTHYFVQLIYVNLKGENKFFMEKEQYRLETYIYKEKGHVSENNKDILTSVFIFEHLSINNHPYMWYSGVARPN
jgi:hypothetical protein